MITLKEVLMRDVCFWSIGDGPYAALLQALVHSYRHVGMEDDFHVISDRQIKEAITHIVPPFSKHCYLFKYIFLTEIMQPLDYRYFVFLDSDNYFVRKLENVLDLVKDIPLHSFLEGGVTSPLNKRESWQFCTPSQFVNLMHNKGLKNEKVYNANGGFFIVEKNAIKKMCDLLFDFWLYGLSQGRVFSDEPCLSYATQMLSGVQEKSLYNNNLHIWAVDWKGVFENQIPYDRTWINYDFYTNEPHTARPAIVHAVKSKDALISFGKNILLS